MIKKILLTLFLLITLATSASAQFTFPINHFSAPAGGFNAMDTIVSSALFDLDATISDSYSGSGQTWANLISSTGTTYDFHLGANDGISSDDPDFTGSADDEAAYFAMDGTNFFTVKSNSGSIFKDMHKTTGASPTWIGSISVVMVGLVPTIHLSAIPGAC